jgi:hypothetical protein
MILNLINRMISLGAMSYTHRTYTDLVLVLGKHTYTLRSWTNNTITYTHRNTFGYKYITANYRWAIKDFNRSIEYQTTHQPELEG